jgi:hypothetical protein
VDRYPRSAGGLPHRKASNLLWLFAIVVFAGSLVPASLTCSFWDNYGAVWAAIVVGFAALAAMYVRQGEPEKAVDLVFGLSVGVAAGVATFFGVLVCSLAFANCG